MKSVTAQLLCLAVCLLAVAGWRPLAAEETAVAVVKLPAASAHDTSPVEPVVVLKDGTRIDAQQVTRTPTTLKLQLEDGQTRIYRLDDVDLDASVGVPPQARLSRAKPRGNGPTRRSSLSSATGTASLQLPEANAKSNADITIVSTGQHQDDDAAQEADSSAALDDTALDDAAIADSEIPEPLRNAMAEVSAAWQGSRDAMDRARERCSGNYLGRSSCGKQGVIGAQHTAPCIDAIGQAHATLRTVEQRYDELWSVARRSGCSPGSTRALLAKAGLSDTRQQAAALRSSLEAITADTRTEPE